MTRRARSSAIGRVRLAQLALALGTLIVMLVLVELGARALYVAPWYERLVTEQAKAESYEYRVNKFGYRGPDYTGPRKGRELRFLVLGDSFTWGSGVTDDEKIFLGICERRLNEELDDERFGTIQMMNGGLVGSLTWKWGQLWSGMKDQLDPDVLLIVFFLRDGTSSESIPVFFDEIRDTVAVRNAEDPLYRLSYLYRFYRDAQDRRSIQRDYADGFSAGYFGDEEQTAEWLAAQTNLKRMVDEAQARGCTVGLVVFPILAGLSEEPYPFLGICELVEEYAGSLGIPTLSLLPAFEGRHGPDLWVSPWDQHPNEAGHAIAAEALHPFLVELCEQYAASERADG